MDDRLPTRYFDNHARRERFPWSLYHASLSRQVARAIAAQGTQPRVLVVGCGLEPFVGGQSLARYYGCDVDARAIARCRRMHPEARERLAVCPGEYELPSGGEFDEPFDVVVAKEVIEHVVEPARWARVLASRVRWGGQLVLTTPNYGSLSTLGLLERTLLEWIARRDGYSRRHIHPSKFTAKRNPGSQHWRTRFSDRHNSGRDLS